MTDQSSQIVHSKILQVMSNLDDIPKLGRNDWHNYNYMQADDVFRAIREQLVNVGLTVTQDVLGADIIEGQWLVSYKFKVTCTETGEFDTFTWAASTPVMVGKEGETVDDKALPKCHTIAKKYAMIHLVFASAGDTDADNQPNPGRPKQKRQHRPKADAGSKPRPVRVPDPQPDDAPAHYEPPGEKGALDGKVNAELFAVGNELAEVVGQVFDDWRKDYAAEVLGPGLESFTQLNTPGVQVLITDMLGQLAYGQDAWGQKEVELCQSVQAGATALKELPPAQLLTLKRGIRNVLRNKSNGNDVTPEKARAGFGDRDDDARRL